MNENTEVPDGMERITELLSDKESLQQIAELADMLRTGMEEQDDCGETESSRGFPDIGMLAGIAGLIGAMGQNDRNTELLAALRPHLGEARQLRLDKAVKLMKLAAVWEAAKSEGLINDLI